MRKAHLEEQCPFDASIDKCLPGVNIRFQRAEEQRQKQHALVIDALGEINRNVTDGFSYFKGREHDVPRMIGEALVETGTNVIAPTVI